MKGIVYKIYCKDSSITECYIGSTNNLQNRKYDHKYNSKFSNKKVYKFIREN